MAPRNIRSINQESHSVSLDLHIAGAMQMLADSSAKPFHEGMQHSIVRFGAMLRG